MATLSETCALTSRSNIAEKGMSIQNLSETLRLLWSHFSVYCFGEKPERLKILMFFSLKNAFLITLIKFSIKFSKEIARKIQSSRFFLFFKKQEFIEVKKNNYYESFREFLKKLEIMSLLVIQVIATGQFI